MAVFANTDIYFNVLKHLNGTYYVEVHYDVKEKMNRLFERTCLQFELPISKLGEKKTSQVHWENKIKNIIHVPLKNRV